MAKEGGEEESKGMQPETNAPSMGSHGNSKGPKDSNFREHDKMLHHAMPEGYKGGDCK